MGLVKCLLTGSDHIYQHNPISLKPGALSAALRLPPNARQEHPRAAAFSGGPQLRSSAALLGEAGNDFNTLS